MPTVAGSPAAEFLVFSIEKTEIAFPGVSLPLSSICHILSSQDTQLNLIDQHAS